MKTKLAIGACAAIVTAVCAVTFTQEKIGAAHVAPLHIAERHFPAPSVASVAPLAFPRYKRNIRVALRFDLCRDNGAEFEKARDNWLSRSERRGYDRASARLTRAYREHGGGDAASENVLRVFCRSV